MTLVHETAWQLLLERLDAVVALDGSLAPARALVKSPVDLLSALGEDVAAALGDDRLALDRFRVLLSTSAVHVQSLSSMRALIAGPASGAKASVATRVALPDQCATGIVDIGGLVLAGLAAARAGAEVGLPDAFVDHVLALSFAATPAEALSRAIAAGLSDSQLRAVLAALVPSESSDGRLSMALVSFVADPCERARWHAIDSLFTLLKSGPPVVWEGATSDGIASVQPRAACEGEIIEVRVRVQPTPAAVAPQHASALLAELRKGAGFVVFASAGHAAVPGKPKLVEEQTGRIQVAVPAGARAGWVGVTTKSLVAMSNASREKLREFWRGQNASHPALKQQPVPVDEIATLPEAPTPARTSNGRFEGGVPVVELFAIEPAIAEPGSQAMLRWRVSGATEVTIDTLGKVKRVGSARRDLVEGQAEVAATLTASNDCGETSASVSARARVRIRDLQVSLAGSSRAPHEGAPISLRARLSSVPKGVRAVVVDAAGEQPMRRDHDVVSLELPAPEGSQPVAGSVRVYVERDRPDDEQRFGPLIVGPPARRRAVILRPARLSPAFARVSVSEAREAVDRAARELGVAVDAVMAPWIEDLGLVVDGVPGGPDTPATRRLLERVSTLSAETSGFEDALWVALLPGADLGIAVVRAGVASAAIAVASPSALGKILKEPPALVQEATDHLTLFGSVDRIGLVRVDNVRRGPHGVGGGAPVKTGLKVFGLDRTGRDVCVVPLNLHGPALPAPFVALLPMSDDITRVEFRIVELSDVIEVALFPPDPVGAGRWVSRRIDRIVGEPRLSDVTVTDGVVHWDYAHERGVRPRITLELGRDGGWWPLQQIDNCVSSVALPVSRFEPAEGDQIRVVATDGWNAVRSRAVPIGPIPDNGAIARYAGERRFWVDLSALPGEATWQIGRLRRKGPVVVVPPGYSGPVTLRVDTGQRVIKDERFIDIHGAVRGPVR